MHFVCFTHSLASDWNHGNAHFLRGVLDDLLDRGHTVRAFEQKDNWSRWHLEHDHGPAASQAYLEYYPRLRDIAIDYVLPEGANAEDPSAETIAAVGEGLELDEKLRGADVVLVHEWNPPAVIAAIGAHRKRRGGYRLLFHDTHHRIVSRPRDIERFDLSGYDGILAFGKILSDSWARRGWEGRVWTWHEAADIRRFRPLEREKEGDLVWIGNWGDEERTAELHTFLLGPVCALGLKAKVHGVRYPDEAMAALAKAGITYGRYLPNFEAAELFARYRVTVHVPRRYYVTHLPGIPTIRPFEAMACGIPLVCSPWSDAEHLFTPGRDYLVAEDGAAMQRHLKAVLGSADLASTLAERGLETIRSRHTCSHRVDELLAIIDGLPTS